MRAVETEVREAAGWNLYKGFEGSGDGLRMVDLVLSGHEAIREDHLEIHMQQSNITEDTETRDIRKFFTDEPAVGIDRPSILVVNVMTALVSCL